MNEAELLAQIDEQQRIIDEQKKEIETILINYQQIQHSLHSSIIPKIKKLIITNRELREKNQVTK